MNLGEQTVSKVPSLAAGALVGNYEVISVLGYGGFAITYKVKNISEQVVRTQSFFALKEFFPLGVARRDSSGGVSAFDGRERDFLWGAGRFVEEALIVQDLRHDNIVRAEGIIPANGTVYMLMEYISGKRLRETILESGPQTSGEIRRWLMPLIDTLRYIHTPDPDRPDTIREAAKALREQFKSRNVLAEIDIGRKQGEMLLHLDITPSNIMFGSKGQPILIDFGAARQKMTSVPDSGDVSQPVANARYAPTEQFTREYENLTPRTDIFSLAGCVYFAATGQDPVESLKRREMANDPLPKLPQTDPLFRATNQALSLDVSRRPESAAAWQTQIGPEKKGFGGIVLPPPSPPPPAPRRASRPVLPENDRSPLALGKQTILIAAVGGALALLLAGIALVRIMHKDRPTPLNIVAQEPPVTTTPAPVVDEKPPQRPDVLVPASPPPVQTVAENKREARPAPQGAVSPPPPPPPPPPTRTVSGVARIRATTSLTINGQVITLAGVRPSAIDGTQAMRALVGTGVVTCTPVSSGTYQCITAQGLDIAAYAVSNGFAIANLGSRYYVEKSQ